MKHLFIFLFLSAAAHGQTDNSFYNQSSNMRASGGIIDISADRYLYRMSTAVIYNALPDGYHVTYSRSLIGKTVEDVSQITLETVAKIETAVNAFGLLPTDMTPEIVALDPVFDFYKGDSAVPTGYKITHNITFNVASIHQFAQLNKVCLEHSYFDLITATAYLKDVQPVYDAIDEKLIALINRKKKFCQQAGVPINETYVMLDRSTNVFYPTERYLKSYLKNPAFYTHHESQNSTLSLERNVSIENHFTYNYNDVDYVFNDEIEEPVIQFYVHVQSNYQHADTEAEIREKIEKEMEEKKPAAKQLFMLNEDGEVKVIEVGKGK